MKRILSESNLGDTVQWPKKDVQRVQEPSQGGGGGGGKMPPGENPPHWPIAQPPPPPSGGKSEGKPEGKDKGDGDGKGEGASESGIVIVENFDDLPDDVKDAIRKELEDMQSSQDTHLDKDTTEGATNSREDREKLKNETNEVRKKAREREEYKNNGNTLSNAWGRMDNVLELHNAEINWREKLKKFFMPWISRKKEQTYTQVNRRDMTTYRAGTAPSIRPGTRMQAPSPNKLHIFVTVDTSGSVDDQMLASFLSEIQGIFTQAVCKDANIEVRLIHWTGEVTGDILLHSDNFKTYFNKIKREASGGTNFASIKQYLQRTGYKPVAIVHFTDADMVFSSDMLFTDNNCKNVIVIPDGFQSTISACEKVFDEVIPMIVYDATKN